MKLNSTLTLLCVIVAFSFCKKIAFLNKTNLHEFTVKNQWNLITQQIGKDVQEIFINEIILTEEGLRKLLQEDLSHLRVLNVSNVKFEAKTAHLLFQQSLIYDQLEVLALDQCNLQSEDFSVLKNKHSKIQKLSLSSNFVSKKGFSFLSRLKMNLTHLNLYQTSLLQTSSVNYIKSWGLNHIIELNIGLTSIEEQNFISLLFDLNTSQIKNLTISFNTFSIPFYKQFAKFDFKNLEFLSLDGLFIGEDEIQILSQMTFPSLQMISFQQNSIHSESGKTFFTKKIFPKLKKLLINFNHIGFPFAEHLVAQKFIFQQFSCTQYSLGPQFINAFSKSDFSQMQKIQFNFQIFTPTSIKKFLQSNQFPKLKVLHFMRLYNIGNIFQQISFKKWPSLEHLHLLNFGQYNQTEFFKLDKIFPKLKVLKISLVGIQDNSMVEIVEKVPKLAPNLENFIVETSNPSFLIYSILTEKLKVTTNKQLTLKIVLEYIQMGYKYQKPAFTFKFTKNEKIKCLQIINPKKISQNLAITQIQFYTHQKMSKELLQNKSKDLIFSILSNLDYSELEILEDNQFVFFKHFYENCKDKCVFKRLGILKMQFPLQKEEKQIFESLQLPSLRSLSIKIKQKTKDQNSSLFESQFTKNMLKLKISGGSIPLRVFQTLIKNQFLHLTQLSLQQIFTTSEQLKQILQRGNLKRIRFLYLPQNLLQKDLSMLQNLTCAVLDLSRMMIGDRIEELCSLNYEFTNKLYLNQINMGDQNLKKFVNCLKSKNQFFPKLFTLQLQQNAFQNNGIDDLLSIKFPQATQLSLKKNKSPQIFNLLFTSQIGRRLLAFISDQNSISSIDPNINRKSTQRLFHFIVVSQNLRDSDFQTLSKFQFNLYQIYFAVKRIKQCTTLKSMRKIGDHAQIVKVVLLSDIYNLTSECMKNQKFSDTRPSTVDIYGYYPYNEFRYFANSFFSQQQSLKIMRIVAVYLSDNTLQKISLTADLTDLSILKLRSNNLTDLGIKHLFKHRLSSLQQLSLEDNFITSKGIQFMINKNFESLKFCDLSRIYIGDDGIQIFVTNNFPRLIALALVSIDLTGKGLKFLENLKAPNLLELDLSCNPLLEIKDLLNFKTSNFPSLKTLYLYPQISSQDFILLNERMNENKTSNRMIVIKTDITHNIDKQ